MAETAITNGAAGTRQNGITSSGNWLPSMKAIQSTRIIIPTVGVAEVCRMAATRSANMRNLVSRRRTRRAFLGVWWAACLSAYGAIQARAGTGVSLFGPDQSDGQQMSENSTLTADSQYKPGVPAPVDHRIDFERALASTESPMDGLPARDMEAFSDFRNAPDGPVDRLDSGQPWRLAQGTDAERMRVADGALTNIASHGTIAGYAEVELPENVILIGATLSFDEWTTGGGAAGVIIWQTEHTVVPNSPMHMVVGTGYMYVDVWDTGFGPTRIGITYFDEPLVPGANYTLDVSIVRNMVEATLSNGAQLSASHPKVATYAGPWACWETFMLEASTDARARFIAVWADSSSKRPGFGLEAVVAGRFPSMIRQTDARTQTGELERGS